MIKPEHRFVFELIDHIEIHDRFLNTAKNLTDAFKLRNENTQKRISEFT